MALLQTDDSNHQISANTIMSAHPFDVVVVVDVVVVSVSVVVSSASADVAIQRLCVRNEVPILMQVITVIATDADIVDIVIHAEGVVVQLQVVQNAKVIIRVVTNFCPCPCPCYCRRSCCCHQSCRCQCCP